MNKVQSTCTPSICCSGCIYIPLYIQLTTVWFYPFRWSWYHSMKRVCPPSSRKLRKAWPQPVAQTRAVDHVRVTSEIAPSGLELHLLHQTTVVVTRRVCSSSGRRGRGRGREEHWLSSVPSMHVFGSLNNVCTAKLTTRRLPGDSDKLGGEQPAPAMLSERASCSSTVCRTGLTKKKAINHGKRSRALHNSTTAVHTHIRCAIGLR